jgi:uncharacterized membrane-anchored protein
VFAAGLAVNLGLCLWSNVSRVLLFWAAFILTRPLGATVGDFLDKPVASGGLALSRPLASAIGFVEALLVGVAAKRPNETLASLKALNGARQMLAGSEVSLDQNLT